MKSTELTAKDFISKVAELGGNMTAGIPYLYYFLEGKDDTAYHMCTLPLHTHYIPLKFSSCYDENCWTWESLYA